MRKFFNYASMVLCGMAMMSVTSCKESEDPGDLYQWQAAMNVQSRGGNSLAIGTVLEEDLDEVTTLDDAEAYFRREFDAAMNMYAGSGAYKGIDAAKDAAKCSVAETALSNLRTKIAQKAESHDFGPIHLTYEPYFYIMRNGATVYQSNTYTCDLSNRSRVFNSDALFQAQLSGQETADSKEFPKNTITTGATDVTYDVANAKLYDKNRDLYIGNTFATVETTATGGYKVSYSIPSANYSRCAGKWYLLIPATEKNAAGETTAEYDVKIKFTFTE